MSIPNSSSLERLNAKYQALLDSHFGCRTAASTVHITLAPDLPRWARIKNRFALWRENVAEKWRCFKHRNDYK
jgi:hypothetical protein